LPDRPVVSADTPESSQPHIVWRPYPALAAASALACGHVHG